MNTAKVKELLDRSGFSHTDYEVRIFARALGRLCEWAFVSNKPLSEVNTTWNWFVTLSNEMNHPDNDSMNGLLYLLMHGWLWFDNTNGDLTPTVSLCNFVNELDCKDKSPGFKILGDLDVNVLHPEQDLKLEPGCGLGLTFDNCVVKVNDTTKVVVTDGLTLKVSPLVCPVPVPEELVQFYTKISVNDALTNEELPVPDGVVEDKK